MPVNYLVIHKEGLTPLHIACAIRGPEGVEITQLLLEAGANPNARASDKDLDEHADDLSPLDSGAKLKPGLDDSVFTFLQKLEATGDHYGGRSPLHIACDRDDDYELARHGVNLLLDHGANPNVLCRGQSPLSLAIASGNDLAIDELLGCQANPSLPLGQSIGSALCVAANTQYEFRRTPQQRIALIDKLVNAGANILAPIAVGAKRQMGTAVDYAYWMFNQDRRIAHMPYHALTHAERDTYNARRKLLGHLGEILRGAAVRREKERLDVEEHEGLRSMSPSHGFLYTGAGAKPSETSLGHSGSPASGGGGGAGGGAPAPPEGGKQVAFEATTKDSSGMIQPLVDREGEIAVRKPLFRYCYECGRSIGVRLSACTRCKEVYYCSKACKIKAWNARHKEECLRVGGRSRSPSPTSHSAQTSSLNNSNSQTGAAYNGTHVPPGSNVKGQAGSNAKGHAGGAASGTKGQAGAASGVRGHHGGSGSTAKGQGGSQVKGQSGGVNGKVRGQHGSGAGANAKEQASAAASKGKVGDGGRGQGSDKGAQVRGQGQQEGGDNRFNGQASGQGTSGGRDAVMTNALKKECTENYSYN